MAVRFMLDYMLKKKKKSKRQLAFFLGIKYGNINRICKENYDARISLVAKCAEFLGCRVRDLIKE